MSVDPRLLLIDMTPISGPSATGGLKAAYFNGWRDDALLHVQDAGGGRVGLASGAGPVRPIDGNCAEPAKNLVRSFRPQVVLYRPVADDLLFHRFAMAVISEAKAFAGVALSIWMMDDWPARLEEADPAAFRNLDRDLRELLADSKANFAISKGMAGAFSARYGVAFEVAHNGVSIEDWPHRQHRKAAPVRMRYAGALAPDTAKDSVLAAASAVSRLSSRGVPVVFEGRTQDFWLAEHGAEFNRLPGVSFRASDMSPEAYRHWLSQADILLVAYNFDEATRRYLQYSFANKLPESLASGAAVLGYGPAELETIAFLRDSGVAATVLDPSVHAIESAIEALVRDGDRRRALGEAGRAYAFAHFDMIEARRRMRERLSAAAGAPVSPGIEAARDEYAQFDECGFVFEVLGAKETPGVMADVGAHVGGSLLPFAKSGWRVFAFEPDRANRDQLLKAVHGLKRVSVSPKAVGAAEVASVAFYRSDVSTGISSLTPFHASHRPAGQVAMTTLDRLIADEGLQRIDFLKIDVEGHEMDVLSGLDFSRLKPRAIVAEFEDSKTRDQGVSMRDLAGALVSQGYTVFVSEWHSVVAYGSVHSWRRLRRYPCDTHENAWGNLIAFIEPPDDQRIAEAFAFALKGGPAGIGARRTVDACAAPLPPPSGYRRLANFVTRRSPAVARLLRPAIRLARQMSRRPQ